MLVCFCDHREGSRLEPSPGPQAAVQTVDAMISVRPVKRRSTDSVRQTTRLISVPKMSHTKSLLCLLFSGDFFFIIIFEGNREERQENKQAEMPMRPIKIHFFVLTFVYLCVSIPPVMYDLRSRAALLPEESVPDSRPFSIGTKLCLPAATLSNSFLIVGFLPESVFCCVQR